MEKELGERLAEIEAEEAQDTAMPQKPDFAASLEEMSPKQLDDLYKEFYFKEEKIDSDEEKFAAISAALAPPPVLQRRLRQAARAQPEDSSQSLQG